MDGIHLLWKRACTVVSSSYWVFVSFPHRVQHMEERTGGKTYLGPQHCCTRLYRAPNSIWAHFNRGWREAKSIVPSLYFGCGGFRFKRTWEHNAWGPVQGVLRKWRSTRNYFAVRNCTSGALELLRYTSKSPFISFAWILNCFAKLLHKSCITLSVRRLEGKG